MRIIVTGFQAFHTNDENPSLEVIRLLPRSIYGNEILTLELPVLYDKSFDVLQKEIERFSPDVVICLGLAQGRKYITPERVAINLDSASIPDNGGTLRIDTQIKQNGKNAYFSTLPIIQMVENIKVKNTPAIISNSAGLYVCNNLMYNLLHYVDVNKLNIQAGFIHVPLMEEQSNETEMFSLKLDIILEGIIDAIKTCIK